MRTALLLSLALIATSTVAGNLERLDQVDLVELEAGTSRAKLLLLLDEDRVNTRNAMKAVFKKVNNYVDFVNSGQLKEAAPNASQEHRPRIVVYGPKDATSAEMQNLAGLKLAGQKAGVEIEVLPYQAGIKSRPVGIKPIKRGAA